MMVETVPLAKVRLTTKIKKISVRHPTKTLGHVLLLKDSNISATSKYIM